MRDKSIETLPDQATPTNQTPPAALWPLLPPRTRQVLQDALKLAGGAAAEPEHLLLALLGAERSGARFLLDDGPPPAARLREVVATRCAVLRPDAELSGGQFSSASMDVLNQASAISRSLKRSYLSTSHLLMALGACEHAVGTLLREQGITNEVLRRRWRRWQRQSNLRRRWALGLEAASAFRPVMPLLPSVKSVAALAGVPWKVMVRRSLIHPGYRSDPFRMYRHLRATRPFSLDPLLPAFVAVNYADVQAIIKDPRLGRAPFLSDSFPVEARRQLGAPDAHRGLPAMMLFADPPRHTRIRAAFMRVFNSVPLEAIRSEMLLSVRSLFDDMASQHSFDLLPAFAGPLPTRVITTMMGFPPADAGVLGDWSDRMVPAIGIHSTLKDLAAADEAYGEFADYLRAKLDGRSAAGSAQGSERGSEPGSERGHAGMLGALVQGDAADLPQEEFIANCMLLLMAGHETTTSLIANGILTLLRHPAQLEIAMQSQNAMAVAVEEILRFESPVQWTGRVALCDVEIAGQKVYRGDLILAGIGAANRDPAVFADPDKFLAGRQENRHIAFGFGIHYCLGAMLAKMEAAVALSEFFSRFPNAKLADAAIRWKPGLVMRCPERLRIRPA